MFAATVKPVGQLRLRHDVLSVAFGDRGELVLEDLDIICLYQHHGAEYSLVKQGRRPHDVDEGWIVHQAVSSDTVVIQTGGTTAGPATHQLHLSDLRPKGRLHHEGELRGVLSPSTLVYGQETADGGWVIALHQPDGKKMVLQPPRGRRWFHGLSVCRAGQHIVVVEGRTQAMDIFTTSGNILLLFCPV